MGYGFGKAGLTVVRLAVLDAGVDEFDTADAIGSVLRMLFMRGSGAGEKDDVAGLWKGVESFERNEVHGGAVVEDELEAVLAVDEAGAGFLALLPALI